MKKPLYIAALLLALFALAPLSSYSQTKSKGVSIAGDRVETTWEGLQPEVAIALKKYALKNGVDPAYMRSRYDQGLVIIVQSQEALRESCPDCAGIGITTVVLEDIQ